MSQTVNKSKPETEIHKNEDDTCLEEDLLQIVEDLSNNSENELMTSLIQLKKLMQTSTTSMTSVPKPLKYLRNSYDLLKRIYGKIKTKEVKVQFADILSVLALAGATYSSRECLNFCLQGTMIDPGDWGHEYIRRLELEIIDEWSNMPIEHEHIIKKQLMSLIKNIIKFDMKDNAEIQACDLSLEIDQIELLDKHLDSTNYLRVCNYLASCAAYSEEFDRQKILQSVANNYLKFGDYCKAILIAMQLQDYDLVSECFTICPDSLMKKQLAFLVARQQDKPLRKDYKGEEANDIETIISNVHVNEHFQMLARELDILEPKLPEEIYKSWLEQTGILKRIEHDSARANLAASFASGFVHTGFGVDKLMSDPEESWVYKNKEHGMLSATASLGLIHMWDVDGGLVPIDKYLYSNEDFIKSGALLAIGIVNCGVRNECDPALALLNEYVMDQNQKLRIGAVLGLGMAYAGTQRNDVSQLMINVLLDRQSSREIVSLAAISLGLINVGSTNSEASSTILQKLLESTPQELSDTYSRFLPLALGLIYMGRRDAIETLSAALEVLPEPYKLASQTMLQVCSYAGTGDVLIVQELLQICSEPVDSDKISSKSTNSVPPDNCCQPPALPSIFNFQGNNNDKNSPKSKTSSETNKEDSPSFIGLSQAIASLGVGVVGLAEGKENSRIFGQVGRYGPPQARRAVPLALALSSISNPDPALVDVLNKYSHDNDSEVSLNAIFGLGLIGAGTNNARLATMLRQLAAYHAKNSSHLFLVRISQGLIHLGKGTLSLCPLRFSSKVLDYTALAGLMVVFVAFLDCKNLILSKSHYLLYCLATAIEPRWIVTLDKDLKTLPVSVRVGQAVDTIGKVGNPKCISGGHVHTTPVLISVGERAELVTDDYEPLSSVMEGFVILREKINKS
ncbi:26S proteasome non-ATPase regulatory subunit 2-like [Leptopilina boulardi]|uniref:26S proteasome non-ATPase regulatory subunit 2-like n=1 Tax=Leptopilina boulardi TaxID=63433 RepID=UPI0021F5DDCD|nr:26S proteasome non-ATPase regulatory subunit 2-like [Leptopilina boulardi]